VSAFELIVILGVSDVTFYAVHHYFIVITPV